MEITRKNLLAFILSEVEKKRSEILKTSGAMKNPLSWVEFEKQAGVPKDTMRDFLRAKTHMPRPDKLQKILGALGYDLIICKREL